MRAAERFEPGARRADQCRLELEPSESLEPRQLRQIVREASQALAFLDAVRLEELAVLCQKLTRGPALSPSAVLAHQARQAAPDMALFSRVLEVTRDNLDVMRRLRDLRQGQLEFNARESLHGHD